MTKSSKYKPISKLKKIFSIKEIKEPVQKNDSLTYVEEELKKVLELIENNLDNDVIKKSGRKS